LDLKNLVALVHQAINPIPQMAQQLPGFSSLNTEFCHPHFATRLILKILSVTLTVRLIIRMANHWGAGVN
jgi:hypothetical protein